jgi:ribonuclease J
MKLTIHRGTHEIGGTCIELQSHSSRILIDFGLPLVDENREPFDSDKIKNKSKKELIKTEVLHPIKGLYKDEQPLFDAILLSHPHLDHYGLLSYINPTIPIYLSEGCKKLIEISYFFGQTSCDLKGTKPVKTWKEFKIGDFAITPYLVDHSGFDALAFLIECEGKRIFYTGDFRGHGRKNILYENLLKYPPKDIAYLILEGSMIGRDKGKYKTEQDIEKALTKQFQANNLFFIACSSQNIDRIVSIYKACKKADRTFLIDPYTAYILDQLKDISPNIPQYHWGKNIKIFFAPNSYTKKMADNKSLYQFKSAKITYDEIIEAKNNLVIKDNYLTRNVLAKKKEIAGSKLIYSMWEGYLPDVKPFWRKYNIPIIKIHTSGHAYIEELQKFVKAIKPKNIIPNHTFYPESYDKIFKNKIIRLQDKQEVSL